MDEPLYPQNPYAPTRSGNGRGSSFRPLVDRRPGPSRVEGILGEHLLALSEAIGVLLVSGRGILLAPTSDGGALSVIVYDGTQRRRSYCSNPEEFEAAIDALHQLAAGTSSPRLGQSR